MQECQATFDPNAIVALLQTHPYHLDALLTMYDLYRNMGENSYAGELPALLLLLAAGRWLGTELQLGCDIWRLLWVCGSGLAAQPRPPHAAADAAAADALPLFYWRRFGCTCPLRAWLLPPVLLLCPLPGAFCTAKLQKQQPMTCLLPVHRRDAGALHLCAGDGAAPWVLGLGGQSAGAL